jgi:WD40 repeat protein
MALRFSPDGRYIAAKYGRSSQAPVRVWDLEQKAKVPALTSACHHYAIDFSPDSRLIALAQETGAIVVLEAATGREVHRLDQGKAPHSLAFHPKGGMIAVSSLQTQSVVVRDIETGKATWTLNQPAPARGMAWTGDGGLFATACSNGRVYVWNMRAPPRLQATLEGHENVAVHVAFNHRGDLLASNGWDGTVRLWDPYLGQPLMHTVGSHYALGFSPDDTRLAAALDGSRIGWWDVVHGGEFRVLGLDANRVGRRADVCPDGRLLALTEADGIRLWDLSAGSEVARLPSTGAQEAIFRRDGTALIVSGPTGLHVWPIAPMGDGIPVGPPRRLSANATGSAGLSLDGRYLVAQEGWHATVFDLTGRDAPVRTGDHPSVSFVAISPDGRWVATGTWHGSGVRVWDARTGKLARELPVPATATVAFSPDDRWLVTSTGAEYCFWDTSAWEPHHRVRRDRAGDAPGYMDFTRRGDLIALTIAANVVQLVEPATGRHVATLEPPQLRAIDSVDFDPAGERLVTVTNGALRIWDLRLIRQKLAAMNLDWGPPPGPTASRPDSGKPIEVKVLTAPAAGMPGS